ncbi:MAG: ABC transporter permease, partial [Rhodosalinus sp.]
MEPLTWTGALGPVLTPLMMAAVAVFLLALVANLGLSFAGAKSGEIAYENGQAVLVSRSPLDYATMAMKYAVLLFLACCLAYIVAGMVIPDAQTKGIIATLAGRLTPVWIALVVTFALSIRFKRRLGLYGKLFDSMIGMIGFGIVMFWVFAA